MQYQEDQELAAIILKSAFASLSPAEQTRLDAYLAASETNRARYRELTSAESLQQKIAQFGKRDEHREANFRIIQTLTGLEATPVIPLSPYRRYGRWAIAASILLLLAAGAYLLLRNRPAADPSPAAQTLPPPGKDGAILTLADGRQLVLDSLNSGLIATQQGAAIRLTGGQLSYQVQNNSSPLSSPSVYNQLTTPRGRQFQLVLPDGSKVWLNASSSIRYPTSFTGSERQVTISGEAYFEIAKGMAPPFKVVVEKAGAGKAVIDVLGTEFNVNAYTNEPFIAATLREGSIRVSPLGDNGTAQDRQTVLKAGQQALLDDTQLTIANANMEAVTAWKNGYFYFNKMELPAIMRQLERWYDVEVTFSATPPAGEFVGKFRRSDELAQILKIFELGGIRFEYQGRKLIVH